MSSKNPLIPVLISKVQEQVKVIFTDELYTIADDKVLIQLNSHLARAKKLDELSYEGEVHNALALYHTFKHLDFDLAIEHLLLAEQCADDNDDYALLAKICSNIGTHYLRLFEFEQAFAYYKKAIKLHEQKNDKSIGFSFAHLNMLHCHVVLNDREAIPPSLDILNEIIYQITVTKSTRNNYARFIYGFRVFGAYAYLLLEQFKVAYDEYKLAHELAGQLGVSDGVQIRLLHAVYEIIAQDNREVFDNWEQSTVNQADANELMKAIVVLTVFEKTDVAEVLLSLLLDVTDSDTIKELTRLFFQERGLTV
ncbi:MAG: tetratricopeptide repeat protein [Chloroflexota bacterium]